MILIKMKPIQRIRKTAGSYSPETGLFIAGSEVTETIMAHVYPIKEKELQFFPEGTRIDSVYRIRTKIPLQSNEVVAGVTKEADILVIAGKKFQIITMGNWTDHQETTIATKYYRSTAMLIEEQP